MATPGGKTLTERTFSGFFWIILGSGVQVVMKISVLAVLARFVTPEEFGMMAIATMAVDFSKMFTHMGVGPGIVQRKELEDRHLTTGFTLSCLMGLIFAAVMVAGAPLLAAFFKTPPLTDILRVISLVFIIDSVTLMSLALIQRSMKFKIGTGLEVISYAVGHGIIGIYCAYAGLGVWALVIATISQAVVLAILLLIAQPFPKKFGFEKRAFKELMFFGGGMTLAKIGSFLALQGDNLVVGRTLGASALGFYGRAYQFMVMPAHLFGNTLDKSLFPAMAKVQDDQKKLGRAFLTGVSIISMLAIPLTAIMIVFAPEIVALLLGEGWLEVILPLQILAGGLLFRMSYKMSDTLARATAAVYDRAWRQWVYALLVVGGSYAGHFFGLAGVASGVAFALVANFLLMGQLSLRLTNLGWLDMLVAHRHGIVFGLIAAGASYGLKQACEWQDLSVIPTLCIGVGGTSLLLAALTCCSPRTFVGGDMMELFRSLIQKRFNKLSTNRHG